MSRRARKDNGEHWMSGLILNCSCASFYKPRVGPSSRFIFLFRWQEHSENSQGRQGKNLRLESPVAREQALFLSSCLAQRKCRFEIDSATQAHTYSRRNTSQVTDARCLLILKQERFRSQRFKTFVRQQFVGVLVV